MIDIPAFLVHPMDIPDLPSSRGSYLLVLYLNIGRVIDIGRSGRMDFPAGYYIYTGSALGSGGIKARLGRHLSPIHKRHWHIDFLREYARVTVYAWTIHDLPRECDWMRVVASLPAATFPAKGFGAGDCQGACPAHLVHFPKKESLDHALAMIRTYETDRSANMKTEVLDNPSTLC